MDEQESVTDNLSRADATCNAFKTAGEAIIDSPLMAVIMNKLNQYKTFCARIT